MTSHLLALKSKNGAAAQLAALKKAAAEQTTSKKDADGRFWKPTFDKEKQTGSAVVRFLPSVEENHLDWVRLYSRNFKGGTGKWYIENCLSTLGQEDPVGDVCSRLWNSGIESDKDVAKKMKRRTSYIANVLVIKDPANRDAEGKVFMWKFGQQIFDIIQDAMSPKDVDEDSIPVFNPFLGANLKVKMIAKDVNGDTVPSYERSTFADVSSIADEDDDVIEICEKAHKLSEFDDAKNFKPYDELKRKLFEVMGATVGSGLETVVGWGKTGATAAATTGDGEQTEEKSATRTRRTKAPVDEVDVDDDIPDEVMSSKSDSVQLKNSDVDPELMKILLG